MTSIADLTNKINEANIVLNAYREATQNNIIALQEKYIVPIAVRTVNDDFSTITGVKITGATNLPNSLTSGINVTAASCENSCKSDINCVGALYTNETCQLYSSIPVTKASYSYDASYSFISYNSYMTAGIKAIDHSPTTNTLAANSLRTVNANVMNALEDRLKFLHGAISADIRTIGDTNTAWDNANTDLDAAKQMQINFKNEEKKNEDVQSQLRNSGLDVTRTKTKYILFIAALLILLTIYIRDFNFSIVVFIILFLMISVYGSIFLGAFLLVLIVLYLVYYAY
jgi:hypothetical protein